MAEDAPQGGGAKELFQFILHKPALLIAMLVGLAIVVFLLIRNGPSGVSATPPASAGLTSGNAPSTPPTPNYEGYQQGYDTGYQRGSYSVAPPTTQSNTPPPSTNPTPPTTTTTTTIETPVPTTTINATATAYSRGVWASEPANSTSALPIWKNPNSDWSQTVGGIPKNTAIQLGLPVTGNYNGQSATYYPVTYNNVSGYIGSWDVGQISGKSNA